MTSSANGGDVSPIARRTSRPHLRQATFIVPKTGERVKRTVTLRDPESSGRANGNPSPNDHSPLLGRRGSRQIKISTSRAIFQSFKALLIQAWSFIISKTGQGVLKCSIAYLLGSMATFVPPIAAILGQQDGKHMVATVTVYFHPARSQGSMFEAMLLAALAFLYAVVICFTSMGVSIFFGRTLDLILVGHAVVLIAFCGGGLGLVGWVKQRLGNPLVNVACSLTSLAIITVLTKEGAVQAASFSDDKVTQVLKMVIMGVVASTAVCFLINPVSARKELRENMIQITDSFADMLSMITRSFLTGWEEELQQESFVEASNRYKAVSSSLAKNLKEAKYEHYVMGTEKEYRLEAELAKCMRRLAQNIGGLRSAAATQFSLLAQSPVGGGTTPLNSSYTPITMSATRSITEADMIANQDNYRVLAAIDEAPEDDRVTENSYTNTPHDSVDDVSNLPSINSPSEIFSRFIAHLGPSMKSLAYTCKKILDELPYGPGPEFRIAINTNFSSSLDEAIHLYSKARTEALTLLYKHKDLMKTRSAEVEADFEEVAASCGHFSFCLQDFAEEMREYLEILDDLKLKTDQGSRRRSWNWLKFWRYGGKNKERKQRKDPEEERLLGQQEEPDVPEHLPTPVERKGTSKSVLEKPRQQLTYFYRLWRVLRGFRRDDTKFAIKVGVGAALYALPSFLSTTRPFYKHWRGEWGLLSYMLVCSMTIGSSNTTSYARFLGTCIGAVCAIVFWIASRGNPFALATFGWLMSLWTAYIIVVQGKGPMGRYIMLTYNLSALYAYSLSVKDGNHDEDEGGNNPMITDITLHRVVAVLSGCLWGLIVTRLIWPISARQKFKDGLSILWLRMGLIWKRDPLSMLLEGESPNAYMDIREEFELQRFLSRLENLRSSASSEIELRGPFPNAAYGTILRSTSRMLDAFHAMNVVIMKNLKATRGEEEILKFTADERAQLGSRIMLASSMKLEYPLSDALPSTEHARDRLLAKVFRFRKSEKVPPGTTDEDFALLYAYALVTGQLSKEIHDVEQEIEKLFGILDEDSLKLQ